MKQYIKPEALLIDVERENILISSREIINPKPLIDEKQHCSRCLWRDDGKESWHCDHSLNPWTHEPFYGCDFYE